jgi:N6-L-threonylcarbamoyladenine synthase
LHGLLGYNLSVLILGIETSCDDSAAAVLQTERPGEAVVLASVVANQDDIHRSFGGIVPELASRNHVVVIAPVIERALETAGCQLRDIDGIAVTRGPGLVGSLLVGLMCAKGLAHSLDVPLVGVNHLEGHLLAPMLEHRLAMPFLALVVSGGHTALFLVGDFGDYREIGRTRDDAAGEAFDKVAKMMALGYPGGKVIDELSRRGDRKRVKLPRARIKRAPLDFSFSGIKTAVALFLRSEAAVGVPREDLAASFQETVVDMLMRPTLAAARELDVPTIVLTGGVAANSRLRTRLAEAAEIEGRRLIAPSLKYCTDNAAMIAMAGSHRLLRGERDSLDVDAEANLRL